MESPTANAVSERRHIVYDVSKLKQYLENVHVEPEDKEANMSWNQYFNQGLSEYHSKGMVVYQY